QSRATGSTKPSPVKFNQPVNIRLLILNTSPSLPPPSDNLLFLHSRVKNERKEFLS
ncbi:uncharacterized protein PgNI_03617, partial [Pyricularia grisea]|uniref:Uncharacterized protein n=1 Tax=Pyricularia grisea TaxID=148305 RepID=A0A6P8B909_PYRGI